MVTLYNFFLIVDSNLDSIDVYRSDYVDKKFHLNSNTMYGERECTFKFKKRSSRPHRADCKRNNGSVIIILLYIFRLWMKARPLQKY